MENSSYSSKSDSFDVEHASHDDPPTANYKVKFLCSYGGKIQPRPHDNQLTYVAGDTKILTVDRYVKFNSLLTKLSSMSGFDVYFKYQLPGEDLDALISVTNDEDLDHMMVEYDRLSSKSSAKPARLQLFLFGLKPVGTNSSFGSSESKSERQWLVDSLSEQPPTLVAVDTPPDYLFGLEESTKQSHSEEVLAQQQEIHRQLEEIHTLPISNSAQDQTSRYYKGEYGNNKNQQQAAFEVKSHAGAYWGAEQHLPGGQYAHPQRQTEQPVYLIQTPTTGMYEPVRQQGYYGMERMVPDVYNQETMGFIRGPADSAYAQVAIDGAGRQVYYATQGGMGMAPPVQGLPAAATTVFIPPKQVVGGPGYVPQVAFAGNVSHPPTM